MPSILIIDDDINVLKSVVRVFSHLKFSCDNTTDPFGHGILDHECDAKYAPCKDLVAILSDYDLRLGSAKKGIDFLIAFQNSKCINKGKIKLILGSGSMPPEVALNALRLKIKPVAKPYDFAELLQFIGVII